ncbi:alpha-1-macroglobulin [Caerostris darwini]|uniref:TEP1-F n=1 Tax=Caerostris darwini TaxID=1538125 RepID=A0AAV4QPY2_9ARAC|nr:alpha-1-macroglobulin [Caerostris darwini]
MSWRECLLPKQAKNKFPNEIFSRNHIRNFHKILNSREIMALQKLFTFSIFMCMYIAACSAQEKTDNSYIFTAPKSLHTRQTNQLQIIRFGCLEPSSLKVQLYVTKDYNSNETLAVTQVYKLEKGKKDSLLPFYVHFDGDDDYVYRGRIQINGTLCGKPISGSDEIHFSNSNDNIYIIQTDKPMYKPGQEVLFRVLKLDSSLRPSSKSNDSADVYVEDPKGTRLFQFLGVQLGKGMIQKKFLLADEPVKGSWRITVSSGKDTESTTFDVKEYRLPKFEVSINFPSFVLRNAKMIPVSVCAKYTYGKPVVGKLNLNTSLEIYSYQSSYDMTPILQQSVDLNGCYNYTVNVSQIDPKGYYTYRRIMVKANVIEKGTGIQINKTEYLQRSYSPLKLGFNTEENHGKFFKPGLPYRGKLTVSNPDGTPAAGESIEICADISRKRKIDIWLASREVRNCKNFTSDIKGIIKYVVGPQNADTVSVKLNARSLKYANANDVGNPSTSAFLDPFYSPSGNFMQLETINKAIPCGTQKDIKLLFTAKKSTHFKLTYQVLRLGKIVSSGTQDVNFNIEDDVSSKYENDNELINSSEVQVVPEPDESPSSSSEDDDSNENLCPSARDSRYVPPIGEVRIPLSVNASLSPSFTLLVFYVREDRETVADSQKIQVEKCFQNKVDLKFKDEVKQPGTPTSLKITSSPNSLCGIKVTDKSVSLLDSSDQLSQDKVFQLIEDLYDPGYYSSNLCYSNKPQPGLELSGKNANIRPTGYSSSYEDSYATFQEAGFVVISNLVLFSRPCVSSSGPSYYPGPGVAYAAAGPAGRPIQVAAAGTAPDARMSKIVIPLQSAVAVRSKFPDTWLFKMQMTDANGVFVAKETLPDTITEWDGRAVCINAQDGLGISNTTSIRGFQPFFISYTLPTSVIRGEEFVIVVSIFNYADAALPITVSLNKPVGFEVTSDLSKSDICIQPSTSESQSIKLKGTKVGSINITVQAQTSSSSKACGKIPTYDGLAKDAITQHLEVEPEGFAGGKTHSILFCPSDEKSKKFSKTYTLSVPKNVVPDSQRAYVDVTGNIMGPTMQNLNNLVSLPTGCGEQNMVKFTPNYLVLDYLTDIGKLTDSIKSNAIRNLNTGYQREMTFRHYDGSFSAFGENDPEGSMFLTAFVLRSFHEAKRYIYIDDNVLSRAQDWITGKQRDDGCFPNVGKIIDSGIQGGLENDNRNGTITAYVLAALLISDYQNQTVINKAVKCMQKNNPLNPYETFLYAYTLALDGNKGAVNSLVGQIQSFANTTDGVTYYMNPDGTKSLNVETDAYAVLANLKVGNSKSDILPLIRYLTKNLNPYGGFHSTQDTCVGLDALSKFAKIIFKDPVDISVSISGGLTENVKITEDNKLLVQRNKVSQVPSTLDITATGTGCGLIQTSLRYNSLTPPENNTFSLNLIGECTSTDCRQRRIVTVVKYLPQGKKSGMSLVQIKMISGTIAVQDSLDQITADRSNNILRTDIENNKVNIYLSEISNAGQQFSFDVQQIVHVYNPQPGKANVFDYYAPEFTSSTTYTFPQGPY